MRAVPSVNGRCAPGNASGSMARYDGNDLQPLPLARDDEPSLQACIDLTASRSPPDKQCSDEFDVVDVVSRYDIEAPRLVPEYERLTFEAAHETVLDLLPVQPASILDVGAGSGRDSAWFAARGHSVIAVEPSGGMRREGRQHRRSSGIRWIDDTLPGLETVLRSRLSFDLIWLSAVWMHVPPGMRARAFRKLVSMMSPGASMMMSLRHGPPPPGRPMAPARAADVETLARQHGLQTVRCSERHADVMGRRDVWWDVIWFRLPDDGTGALPLLRHVVFNDRKSSTYKPALLRTLIRIADGAGGFARPGIDDNHTDLPLGLVALFWIRAFQPLVARDFAQHPSGNRKLSFVKDGFRSLMSRSPQDLRIGQTFNGDDAENLVRAMRDAAACIQRMPARHITYPGTDRRLFPCRRRAPVRVSARVRLDEAFLWSFGTLSVPVHLWQAMSRHAPWIEPAVLNEWVTIMNAYAPGAGTAKAEPDALRWLDPEHDTRIVRDLGARFRERGSPLYCIWTGQRLRDGFHVDHCFPFAAWPCNDLWNLLPSARSINLKKGNRLPTAGALEAARSRMLDWWDLAYLRDPALADRFDDESRGALPMAVSNSGAITPDSLFEGVMFQQLVLKRDQQLADWQP